MPGEVQQFQQPLGQAQLVQSFTMNGNRSTRGAARQASEQDRTETGDHEGVIHRD